MVRERVFRTAKDGKSDMQKEKLFIAGDGQNAPVAKARVSIRRKRTLHTSGGLRGVAERKNIQ